MPTASPSAVIGAVRSGGKSDGDDWGDLAGYLDRLGLDPSKPGGMAPIVLTAGGVVALLGAFLLFGRRRRNRPIQDGDSAAAAVASSGMPVVPPPPAPNGTTNGSGPVAGSTPEPGSPEAELALPRWRRPSLMAARKADPTRDAPRPSHRLSFDQTGAAPPGDGERRTIRYTAVRLLDAPDELRAAEIGVLDQGDEVQLIEKSGTYWRVLCPDGREGWLHKTTLGDAPGRAATSAAPGGGRDAPLAQAPDSLAAYLASRARS